MGGSSTTNKQNTSATNTASNTNQATNFGTDTGAASGSNIAANTAYASGPSQAGQALITAATSPANTISNLQSFLNPYTQDVLGAQQAIQQQQQGQALNAVAGNAIANSALGGNRLGVAQANTLGQLALANNAANAGTLQQGFNTALQAAQNTAAQQLQGAGLAGTQGSTAANTGQLGQQLSSTLGQTRGATSQAQAQAGVGNESDKTTQNPGILGYTGLGLGLLSDERVKENIAPVGKTFDGQHIYKFNYTGSPETHIGLLAQEVEKHHPEAVHGLGALKFVDYNAATADATRQKHYDAGGGVSALGGSNYVPVTYNGQTVYVPSSSISNSPQGSSGLSSLGGPSVQNAMQMYNLGSQARNTLSNFLGGTPSGQQPQQQSAQTPAATIGKGLSSLGNAASSGLSSLGSALGFASGGNTAAAPAAVSIPSLGSFNATPAASPVSGLSSSAFYAPAVAAPANPTMPSFSMPSVSMPAMETPTVEQAVMPSISYPPFGAVSSGKGSGGAVRGLENGGLARLLKEFKGSGKIPGRANGGDTPSSTDPEMPAFMKFLADQQTAHNAANAPGPEPKTPSLSPRVLADISPASAAPNTTQAQPTQPPISQPAQDAFATAKAAPVSLGQGFAMIPGQRPALPTVSPPAPNPAAATPAPPVESAPAAIATPPEPQEVVTGISDNGVDYIKSKEGFSANPYSDYHQTSIGFGSKSRPGDTSIDAEEAERRLRDESRKTAEFIRANAKVPLNQNQFDALTSFGYNTGNEPLSKVLSDLNKGDTAAATARMQQYINAGGKPSEDLKTRRAEEVALFNGTSGEPGARPSPLIRQALLQPANLIPAKSQPWSTDNFLSNLGNSLRGSPLGKAAYGDLSGLAAMAPMVSALAGGPGGLGMSRAMQEQQQLEINRQIQERERAKLRMEMATPKVIGQTQTQFTDQFGIPHVSVIPQYGTYDVSTGKFPVPPAASGSATASSQTSTGIPQGLAGQDAMAWLKSNNPMMAGRVQEFIDGRAQIPSGRGLQPQDRQALALAEQITDGKVSQTTYPAMQKAVNSFYGSGKDRQNIQALGTAIYHTAKWDQAIDKLGNYSDYSMLNAPRNFIREQTSPEFRKAVGEFEPLKTAMIDEVNRAVKGGMITVTEGDEWKHLISTNAAPDKLHSIAHSFTDILNGRLEQTVGTYNQEMHRNPGDYGYKTAEDFFTPQTKALWDQLKGEQTTAASNAGNTSQPSAPPAAAIEMLRKNPGLKQDFEEKYGVPADTYLKQ